MKNNALYLSIKLYTLLNVPNYDDHNKINHKLTKRKLLTIY